MLVPRADCGDRLVADARATQRFAVPPELLLGRMVLALLLDQEAVGSAMLAAKPLGFSDPFSGSTGWTERFGDEPVSQFYGAEKMVKKWNLNRREMEEFALESHRRGIQAIKEGRFDREIVPVGDFAMDETTRETSLEKMAELDVLADM